MSKPRILTLDIETAPALVYVFGLYNQNIGLNQIKEPHYMLCWSARWYGESEMLHDRIINYPDHFKKNPTSDLMISKSIWTLLDEADVVIAHNGDNFDLKWLNTCFIKNDLKPVSTYKSVDTLKQAKNNFYFLSNKLDHITKVLSVGEKVRTGGFDLWPKCMAGDEAAWKLMSRYNKNDVRILEMVYDEMKPFMKNHPNLSLITGDFSGCPDCSGKVIKYGFAYTNSNKYQRFKCISCGKSLRGSQSLLSKEDKEQFKRGI